MPSYKPYEDKQWPRADKGYAAMIALLDRDVGRLLNEVKAQGIEGNTLVIFTSDNGTRRGRSAHGPTSSTAGGRCVPRRAACMREGSANRPSRAGLGESNPDRPATSLGLFWDFSADRGPAWPECQRRRALTASPLNPPCSARGQLSIATCTGSNIAARCSSRAVRMGNWKGLRLKGPNGPMELYRLDQDPGESRDRQRAESRDCVLRSRR